MSFKRDGDDISLLNRLKNDRVSELLGEYIPEDEAKLLSNGRLTCLVCTHRPIFDTTSMLSKHRQGRKHLFELNKYIKRNEQLEIEKIKKEQQVYLENCKKTDLANSKLTSMVLGPKDYFASSSSDLNPIGRRKVIEVPKVYRKPVVQPTTDVKNSFHQSSSSQLRKYLKSIKKKRQLEEKVAKEKSGYSSGISNVSHGTEPAPIKNQGGSKVPINVAASSLPADSDLSRNLSGWIKDKFGNWIKDPEAEFDTDEE
ncbi:hypothetical protein O3M35_008995 [Rhynocoris fuscipes]|uniref:Sodium channel modifier 1 n=1 Tax=Rhynocoris fuscipes TaxID=488301 RepID=A0AAW1D2R3_9HEMI